MSMNPYSPVGPPSGGFALTPEQRQARINRLMNGDYRRQALLPPQGAPRSGFMFESAGQNTVTVPGVGANVTNESPLAALLRQRSYLDPMSQAMWDADPRNQAEIARLRREEAGLPPEATPSVPGDNSPNNPPPGGWDDNTTYEDIFGTAPEPPPGTDTTASLVAWLNTLTPAQRVQWSQSPRTAGRIRALGDAGYVIGPNGTLGPPPGTVPPPAPPRAPGAPTGAATVPGSVWNNPDSAAPRGYNPELWAQREIGPNRTSAGVGGPRNADGTAMYAPPPEYKPTRGIDLFGYEPAPRKPAEFSGFTIGDDGFYKSDRGGSGAAYDENLLATLKAAADAGEGRANYILSALSTGADMARPVYSAQMNQYGANPIDNYAAQYDWEQEVLGKKEIQRKLKQGWTLGENRQLVPPSGWVEDNNGGWRPPVEDTGWTQVGNGGRWKRTENTSAEPEGGNMGKDDKERKNPFMNRMGDGTMRYAGGTIRRDVRRSAPYIDWANASLLNPKDQSSRDVYRDLQNSMSRPLVGKPQAIPVRSVSVTQSNPFSAAFTTSMPNPQQRVVPVGPAPVSPGVGRLPLMTQPSQNFPMDPQRRPVLIGQPHTNPFLMGGANRVNGNPFRR